MDYVFPGFRILTPGFWNDCFSCSMLLLPSPDLGQNIGLNVGEFHVRHLKGRGEIVTAAAKQLGDVGHVLALFSAPEAAVHAAVLLGQEEGEVDVRDGF